MNRNSKIIAVSAFALVALILTTGWGVLAGADWPSEPYQEYSRAGTWTVANPDHLILTISPRDPVTGISSHIGTNVTPDPTLGGLFPEATSTSPTLAMGVKTGPNTDHTKGVSYVLKAGTPRSTILGIVVVERPTTLIAPDEMELNEGTVSFFKGTADKDGDGLPDADEQPIMVVPVPTVRAKRI